MPNTYSPAPMIAVHSIARPSGSERTGPVAGSSGRWAVQMATSQMFDTAVNTSAMRISRRAARMPPALRAIRVWYGRRAAAQHGGFSVFDFRFPIFRSAIPTSRNRKSKIENRKY